MLLQLIKFIIFFYPQFNLVYGVLASSLLVFVLAATKAPNPRSFPEVNPALLTGSVSSFPVPGPAIAYDHNPGVSAGGTRGVAATVSEQCVPMSMSFTHTHARQILAWPPFDFLQEPAETVVSSLPRVGATVSCRWNSEDGSDLELGVPRP